MHRNTAVMDHLMVTKFTNIEKALTKFVKNINNNYVINYFQIIERLNVADTRIQIMEKDLEENTEFRIKWPRGQLGSLPADSEQFMMIEDLYKATDKLSEHIDSMALNKVNIEFLRKQMDKVLADIESLKDKARDMHYKNGNGQ